MPNIGQQHSIEKSRQLQRNLYLAAKKDKQRGFHALYDRIFRLDILWRAWKEVRENKGSARIDNITFEMIEEYGVEEYLLDIQEDLQNKKYRPKQVKRVYIPKPDGKQRPLGIPTIRDRIVQQACKIVIEPVFKAKFLDNSYGFCPKRDAKQTTGKVKKLRFTRYADDVLIFTKSEIAANRVMKSMCSWLERKLFLKVNATKTKVVRPTRSKYLGFTFLKNGSDWKVRLTNEKKKKLKKKLSEYQKRGKVVARPLAVTIKRVNEIVQGWINYFRIGMMKLFLEEFGEWLRHKIRVIVMKQWKRPKTIYRNLSYLNRKHKNGFSNKEIFKVANSRPVRTVQREGRKYLFSLYLIFHFLTSHPCLQY